LSKSAGIEVVVHCEGDLHIDDHHTAEDVAITLGQCLHESLGDKRGLARMGCAEGAEGGAICRAVLDLSNRPHFESDLQLDEEYVGGGGDEGTAGTAATLSCEMLYHVFESLTLEMRATAHLEVVKDACGAGHTLDLAISAARAYGRALRNCAVGSGYAPLRPKAPGVAPILLQNPGINMIAPHERFSIRVDPRRKGAVASSKGTLSK